MKTKQPKYTAGYRAVFRLIESFLDFMEKKDVSKAELARRTGVKRSSVTKWFSPGRNLTIFTAAMIAEALDAELRFLVVNRATEKPVVEFETQEPVTYLLSRYPRLGYRRQGEVWRLVDMTTKACIGPEFASEPDLLRTLDQFSEVSGCAALPPAPAPALNAASNAAEGVEALWRLVEEGLWEKNVVRWTFHVEDSAFKARLMFLEDLVLSEVSGTGMTDLAHKIETRVGALNRAIALITLASEEAVMTCFAEYAKASRGT
jgi:transcriptional regulator with XRE-family HTH domain